MPAVARNLNALGVRVLFPLFTFCLANLMTSHATAADFELANDERIVFLGDSITEAGAQEGGYVTLVKQAIAKERPDSKIEVLGAGISGNRVPDLEKRLEKDVLAKKPTTVVIYIGINDVWHSQSGNGTPAADFEAGLRRIISKLQKAKAKVLLCTASVIGEKPTGDNPLDGMLDEYCDLSRKVARETKSGTIDLRHAFLAHLREHNKPGAENGVLTTDGVHLNAVGNQFVADRMLEALSLREPAKRLRHMVLFKFKADVSPEQVQEVVDAFAELPNKIDTIVEFESGVDVSVENLADGFTHGFLVTFADKAGRETYLPHPAHKAFVDLVGPRVEKVLVFDYWAGR